jgi:hypothetical protein
LREPSLTALGAVLAGEAEALGRLPAPIGDLYPVGWGRQPGGA